jgi:hypothetical protein
VTLPIEGADYFIYLMKMPPKICACVCENEDGTYTMFLDPSRSFDQIVDDYEHELWHIIRDDMHSSRPIYVIEAAS